MVIRHSIRVVGKFTHHFFYLERALKRFITGDEHPLTDANWLNFISGPGQPPGSPPPSVESRKSTSWERDHHERDVHVQVGGDVGAGVAAGAESDTKHPPVEVSSVVESASAGTGGGASGASSESRDVKDKTPCKEEDVVGSVKAEDVKMEYGDMTEAAG
jgi:hypothetical protein